MDGAGVDSMKSLLLMSVLVSLSLEEAGPTICTLPSGTCYAGSQLGSDLGTQYYSFQGIRSVSSAQL